MRKNAAWIVTVVILSSMLILSMVFGSGGILKTAAPTATKLEPTNTELPTLPTSTPDPCSTENIPEQIARVHLLSREFEDTSQLIRSTLLQATTVGLVQDLQKTKRTAEDQVVPSCLADLKQYQIAYMNATIDVFGTALAFLNTYGPNPKNQDALNSLLEPLQQKSSAIAIQYTNEYARLLGFTPMPISTINPLGTSTPSPQ